MPEKTIKVCAYNIRMKDQYPGQELANMKRGKLIAGLLAKSDYDVLVFSEAFEDDVRKEMIKILSTEGKYLYQTLVVGYSDDFNPIKGMKGEEVIVLGGGVGGALGGLIGGALGVVAGLTGGLALALGGIGLILSSGRPKSDGGIFMMSRWPIELQSQIVYRDGTDFDRFGKKGVSWAVINKEGFYFQVFGSHTQSGSTPRELPPGLMPIPGRRDPVPVRRKQFAAFRAMIDSLQMYWMPALLAGDLNVDFCFDRDRCPDNRPNQASCCSNAERVEMLNTLRAAMPGDLSRYAYTSDPANEFHGDDGRPTTLDYVLHSTAHRAPVRSSLETIRPRTPWTEVYIERLKPKTRQRNDLSDHYAVVGTYTFPHVREDTPRFIGVWRCITFNGRPDTHRHRLTFYPFGACVVDDFDGKVSGMRIQHMAPGGPGGGEITFRRLPSNEITKYEYTFRANRDFDRYFIGGEIRGLQNTRPQNELTLRNQKQTAVYAFEEWMPLASERPGDGGSGPRRGGSGDAGGGTGEGGTSRGGGQGGSSSDTDRPRRER